MRHALYILSFVLSCSALQATHIIGGNFNVEQTGRNEFYIDLIIFRDCRTNVPNPPVPLADSLQVRIFNQSDINDFLDIYVLKNSPDRPQLGDDCFEPSNICVEEYHLADTISLPDNPSGYLLAMQICCRNFIVDNILNPGATGMTLTAQIPDPAIVGGNSGPQLAPYPDNGFLCLFFPRSIDLSAFDPNGDSLYYELTTPLTSPPPTSANPNPSIEAPPYNPVNWVPGYTAQDPIPGSPGMALDPNTGILSVTPIELGLFVFAYKIEEYRNGQFIGSTRRDIQIEVLGCTVNEAPVFEEPLETEFSADVNENFCVRVRVADPNSGDTIRIRSTYSEKVPDTFTPEVQLINRQGIGVASGNLCWKPSCDEAFLGQVLNYQIVAVSSGCDVNDTIRAQISISSVDLPDDILSLLPNIFSPNNDGVNDVYMLQSELPYPCIEDLQIRIFNRWGVEVYYNSLSNQFGWDGQFNGSDASPGVYYYVLSGSYGSSTFERRSFLTLVR